jgi:hypothetical protein
MSAPELWLASPRASSANARDVPRVTSLPHERALRAAGHQDVAAAVRSRGPTCRLGDVANSSRMAASGQHSWETSTHRSPRCSCSGWRPKCRTPTQATFAKATDEDGREGKGGRCRRSGCERGIGRRLGSPRNDKGRKLATKGGGRSQPATAPRGRRSGSGRSETSPVVLVGQHAGRTIGRARCPTLDEVTLPSRRCPTSTLHIPLKMLRRIGLEAERRLFLLTWTPISRFPPTLSLA